MLFHFFWPAQQYEHGQPKNMTLLNARGDQKVIARKLADWQAKAHTYPRFEDWCKSAEVGAVLYVWNDNGDTGAIVRVR